MTEAVGTDATSEMAEFAAFPRAAQIYIAMVLDCVLERGAWRDRWRARIQPHLRDRAFANMAVQRDLRERLLRFWETKEGDAEFMPLVMTGSWDIAMADLQDFSHYRFLGERLYGSAVRPLLPSSFAAAALLPHHPVDRCMALLATLTQEKILACNSPVTPVFFPSGDVLFDADADA